jgi:hypothetical protein
MLQFKLRTLFIATTASAALLWAFYAPPQWLGLIAIYLFYFLLPAVAVAGIVFHRGYRQAFFIGMAPWIAIVSFWLNWSWQPNFWPPFGEAWNLDPDQVVYDKLVLVIPLAVAVASGLVAVGIRWWALSLARKSDKRGHACRQENQIPGEVE